MKSLSKLAWGWLGGCWVFCLLFWVPCRVLAGTGVSDFVTSVPIEHLIRMPGDLFDLQGKTIRFTPVGQGSYRVQTAAEADTLQCNQALENQSAQGPWYSKGWSVAIPFAFPFGGKVWDHLYVNMDGNLSFDEPESVYWPDRDPWADGGMVSVAAAIDSRSAAGLEKMIAVLWGPYQNPSVSQVSIQADSQSLAITWNMTRAAWGEAVLGVNTFQARLYPSGVIEFAYPHVAERDGIVGIFPGQPVSGKLLSHWTFNGHAPHPSVDIDSGDVYDAGTVLDLAMTMKNDALTRVDSGPLDYRCWVTHDGVKDVTSVSVSDGQPKSSCWLGASPRSCGWKIDGRRVDIFVSKALLAECRSCSVAWDATWWGKAGRFAGSGWDLPAFDMSGVAPASIKFSEANEAHRGNIFQVFHYPVVTKYSERLLQEIYKQLPGVDDIAIVFTDFRIDDLYGQGGGAIAANFPIRGIGSGNAKPRSTAAMGTTQLQMSVATVWLGAPQFDPSGTLDDGTPWVNYARGVKWVAHECTHRWGMDLSFVNPESGKSEKLTDSVGHWRQGLDSTVMFPVTDLYLQRQGVGGSIMGGSAWRRNSDGTFGQSDYPFQVPGGYSALDLYVMGMLPADRVLETGVIEDLQDLGQNRFSGSAVRVKISDIIATMGERVPSAADAQKIFHMKFYVVHQPGREADPAMMERARELSIAVANYFFRATGRVMRVVASGS
jgi:hypothetical protein